MALQWRRGSEMNSLSWFIYLTQIVDNVREFAVGVSIFVGLSAGIALGFFVGHTVFEMDPRSDRDKWAFDLRRTLVRAYISVMVPALLLALLAPTRQTMLMIAGSEMGERLVNSDAGNQGLDLIRKWIKQETDKIKEKT
jgi:hypothetical protein